MERMTADATSVLRTDVFRSVVTIIIPGLVATSPFLALVARYCPWLSEFVRQNAGLSSLALLLIAMTAGHVIEDLGSRIEAHFWDACLKRRNKRFIQEWKDYLRLAFEHEPVGQHYLKTILLRFKFETNLAVSLIVSLLGMISYGVVVGGPGYCVCSGILFPLLAAYLLYESKTSCKVLADIRHQLLKGVIIGDTERQDNEE
jgi:hypothetical protein